MGHISSPARPGIFTSQRPHNEAFRTPSTPGRQAKLILNPSADMGNNHFLFSGFFSDFLKPKKAAKSSIIIPSCIVKHNNLRSIEKQWQFHGNYSFLNPRYSERSRLLFLSISLSSKSHLPNSSSNFLSSSTLFFKCFDQSLP